MINEINGQINNDLKNNKRKKCHAFFLTCLIGICIAAITGCSIGYEDYSASGTAMDTILTANIRVKGSENGQNVWNELLGESTRLEQSGLSRRVESSEIAAINASAGSEDGYPLSDEMENYLELCLELSEETDGAFDISIGALAQLWNIDEAAENPKAFVMPTDEQILAALAVSGYEKIKIEDHRIYIPDGMVLDMGAVGKGIFLGEAYSVLKESAISGVVAAGGSILTYGYKAGGNDWKVGIVDPFDTSEVIAVLSVEGSGYISTSGDYERYVEYNGVRYHHILDPHTGYPADTGIRGVSAVLTAENELQNGLLSDAITTAVFVMGEEKGIELAEKYGAELLIVRDDGSVYMSDGMQKMAD